MSATEDADTEAISMDAFADIEDLLDLVEDEVLLGLPIAPMHEDVRAHAGRDPKAKRNDRPSPFAVLEKLKPNS